MADRARDVAREQAGRMQGQGRGVMQELQKRSPNAKQVVGVIALLAGGAVVLVVGGVAVTGTVIALLLASPLLLLFSPILVPLAIVAALAVGGLVSFIAFFSAVSWLYNYAKGRHPVGADRLDAAKHRIADTASHVTEKAREVTGYLQARSQEAAPGA